MTIREFGGIILIPWLTATLARQHLRVAGCGLRIAGCGLPNCGLPICRLPNASPFLGCDYNLKLIVD